MRELTLAEKLLARVGEISRRSDVVVRNLSRSWGGPIGKWKDTLPPDMFELYSRLNGLVFHYSFKDEPEGYHGFQLLALDSDGKKVIDPRRSTLRIPRQAAKRYPEYFFQEGAVSPSEDVLFFMGSDDAWGVLMLGAGANARFVRWNNDGYVEPMPATFTQVLERLMDNGFAHTWAYDSHPESDAVRARLAKKVDLRHTFDVVVHSRTELSESAYRQQFLSSFDDATVGKIAKALGKPAKDASRDALVALIDEACSKPDAITDKSAVAAMKATGHRKPTRELFVERFAAGSGPLAELDLTLRYRKSEIPFATDPDTLVRALDSLEGSRVGEGYPGVRSMLQYEYPPKSRIYFSPFVKYDCDYPSKGTPKELRYKLLMHGWRAAGLEANKTYASTALSAVEDEIKGS
ncbi:MAG: hypothetical protein U0269_27690 [Polyangiales bacterium]